MKATVISFLLLHTYLGMVVVGNGVVTKANPKEEVKVRVVSETSI